MSKFFDDDIIEQVKNANDIVSVISEHIPLKKKGKNYWGCCPFHNKRAFFTALAVENRGMSSVF